MISIPDRRETVTLIKKARQSGARLEKACAEAGISSITCPRWKDGEDIKSDGRPTADRPAPANTLTKKHVLGLFFWLFFNSLNFIAGVSTVAVVLAGAGAVPFSMPFPCVFFKWNVAPQ
jgi:hypothetical protein